MRIYNIADLCVAMTCSGRTLEQAKPYLSNEHNEKIDICITPETISQAGYDPEKRWPDLSEDLRVYMGTGGYFYRKLLDYNGMMLHSSCVVVDGLAYLFSATSGTGKSTHTARYLEMFGDRAYILNDDKPAIRLVDGIWYAYGTPWSGKCDISVNTKVPVAGIAMVERGVNNEITAFEGLPAIEAVISQVNRPRPIEYRAKLLRLLDQLITQVPIWKLKCNMDPEAAIVSYEAMSGQKYEKGI